MINYIEQNKEENNMSVNAENIHKLLTKYCGKYVPDCKIDYAKKEENTNKNIVVLFPDSGDRYLSTDLFNLENN